MPLLPLHHRLQPRDNNPPPRSESQTKALILAVVFVAITVFAFFIYIVLRYIRRSRSTAPWFIPPALRHRWVAWAPGVPSHTTLPSPVPISSSRPPRVRNRSNPGAGINRESSIRSIMTLPEYRAVAASDRERTIGREGERGGMDVVLEFPESQTEEEERREDHMQTLYEIRLARQLERAEQRESGDLAAAARDPATVQSTQSLLQTLQTVQDREARLSQVSYAEVGIQRPDGSRVRPSMDSDRPLLGGAATMGGRQRSSSIVSYSESPERRRSDEFFGMGGGASSTSLTRERTPEYEGRSTVNLVPPESTPDYEGGSWGPPPEYTSPIEMRNRGADTLPILRVDAGTPSGTPATSRSPSPRPSSEVPKPEVPKPERSEV